MAISINDLEQAINFWRTRSPSDPQELRLCAEAAALAEPYALMILQGERTLALDALSARARAAFDAWRASDNAGSGG